MQRLTRRLRRSSSPEIVACTSSSMQCSAMEIRWSRYAWIPPARSWLGTLDSLVGGCTDTDSRLDWTIGVPVECLGPAWRITLRRSHLALFETGPSAESPDKVSGGDCTVVGRRESGDAESHGSSSRSIVVSDGASCLGVIISDDPVAITVRTESLSAEGLGGRAQANPRVVSRGRSWR